MSIPILILGDSGTGKSTSLRNFKKGEAVVVNVLGKPLPFRGEIEAVSIPAFEANAAKAKGSRPLKIDGVRAYLTRDTPYKAVVVDDFGYVITDMFMRWTVGEEKFKDQFQVYKEIAGKVWNLLSDVMADGKVDRIVYFVMHTETENDGSVVPMTVGRLLNEKVNIKGLCTCIFQSAVAGDEYVFVTNNGNPAKSPLGMFGERTVPNDLRAIDATIRDYYGYPQLDSEGGGE